MRHWRIEAESSGLWLGVERQLFRLDSVRYQFPKEFSLVPNNAELLSHPHSPSLSTAMQSVLFSPLSITCSIQPEIKYIVCATCV